MKRVVAEISALVFVTLAVAAIVVSWYSRRARTNPRLGQPGAAGKPAPSALVKQLAERATRVAAARELGRRRDAGAVEYLPVYLNDEDPEVRLACVQALAEIGDPRAAMHLRWRLADADRRVRLAAVEAVGKVPDDQAAKELVALLRDSDAGLRAAAKRALLAIGAPALEPIEAAAGARGPDTRLALIELLGAIGGAEVAPALVKLLATTDPTARRRAAGPNDEVRQAAIAALVAVGEPAVAPLDRAIVRRPASLHQKRAAAEVFRRLGKPAIAPIAKHVLAWKTFPRPDELALWVQVLQAIGAGDPQARRALDRAREQLDRGALAAILRGEAPEAPATPPGAQPPPPLSPVELPPAPSDVPDTGLVRLVLHRALVRLDQPPERARRDLELELTRHEGTWRRPVLGKSVTYNQGNHEGILATHADGAKPRLRVEMVIEDDPWGTRGGFGAYDIELSKADGRVGGSYRGRFNGREVSGAVSASFQQWPPSAFQELDLRSGEHPRLLFRRSQLPRLRRRARTRLGRAIVRQLLARINDDRQTVDHAIAWGLLSLLLDDPQYGRQAVPLIREGIDAGGGGHIHDSARRMLPVALAYDLAYGRMTPDERKTLNGYVVRQGAALGARGLGNNCLSANSNWSAISFGPAVVACLAGLKERAPFELRPPTEHQPVVPIPADPRPLPRRGVPAVTLADGELLRDWLLAGPFEGGGNEHPLAGLGGCEAARPQAGTAVSWRGRTLRFAKLPATACRKVPPFLRMPGEIRLHGAKPDSRSYLYCLLRVEREQGARVACSHRAGGRPASLWINGRRFADHDLVAFAPGTHRLLLEAVGGLASPWLSLVDAGLQQGLWERYRRKRQRWEARKALHQRTGESQSVAVGLDVSTRLVGRWFRHAIGDHAWKTEPEGYHGMSLSMVLPAAAVYPTVTGRQLVYGTGLPWVVPLELFRTCASGGGGYSAGGVGLSSGHLCYAMHLAPPELQPALVWEFNRRFLPDKLDALSCQEMLFAFVHYPLHVAPRHPDEVMPRVIADRRKGAFLFRNRYKDDDDFVAHVFFRAEQTNGPAYFHPQAGSFRISGLGTAWAVGLGGDKRNWQYAQENVVTIEGNNGSGNGSVVSFSHKANGSGVVAADLSDVYSRRSARKVQASRHVAVDYSGTSGAPALVAVVDRIRGGGTKSWLLHTGGGAIHVAGNTFTIRGKRGGTLTGRFLAPADVRLSAEGSTLKGVTEAETTDYFVVMTIQRDSPPAFVVEGDALAATVRIGQQAIRFDGRTLALSH